MAGIDVGGGHGGKKSVNHEIPLIPFIDFLLCLVAFLLVTAVWSQMARINADATVPGPPDPDRPIDEKKPRQLHVEMKGDRKFQLVWKEGSQVLNTIDVDRRPEKVGDDEVAYPDLAKKVEEEWNRYEARKYAATEKEKDQAVLHTDNSTKFSDVIAVIDAVYTPKRPMRNAAGADEMVPAFNITFSVN
jgi:biopolymer transport protein ExbD